MSAAGADTSKTVLVVEDDEWLRPLLAELLRDEGYRVVEAGNGPAGLSHIQRDLPDVVVLDVGLPWRSGLDVLDDLRAHERTRGLPVVLVSGCIDLIETHQAQRAAAAFHKPLDFEALLNRIRQTVHA